MEYLTSKPGLLYYQDLPCIYLVDFGNIHLTYLELWRLLYHFNSLFCWKQSTFFMFRIFYIHHVWACCKHNSKLIVSSSLFNSQCSGGKKKRICLDSVNVSQKFKLNSLYSNNFEIFEFPSPLEFCFLYF